MYIYSYHQLARDKVNRIKLGYSAYAETDILASLIKKELKAQNIRVFEDVTDFGSWFIPE
ncbi:hypothetical protein ACH95_02930 [Bacillus glycinifermentans]|uniref:Uncharacterized protein n=1 Tax=Bacillus glycinifermentans TaxID=1664069 RepID=A0A0J6EE75_9BACI|nr:hypothetical protein [Bacillus glycinifermentans]ATH92766.1 hypothetical protein COP00_09155 [Bacillus glycinifermentans]KMM63219.1 hypothetical protein ACH95_02930 [Bacillus glycinifermentans]KRT94726.1 hypothetical protein AB447_213810 [Bacillus glycinifermentans]MEC0485593.1 hypothetical protein [Bacillus glycinifermentans]MEC0493539.1 hypothetical protein [Bacillus glycinifermentans]